MSNLHNKLICGFTVTATRERISSISTPFYSSNEPPMVTLFRLGSDVRAWLSPEEARQLSAALLKAAEFAEPTPPPTLAAGEEKPCLSG